MAMAPRSAADFLATAERQLDRAATAGARLLALPEYVSEAWLSYAPPALPETAEIAWMAQEAERIFPAMGELARARGLALLAGTAPFAIGGGHHRNRAVLYLPDGGIHTQDKLSLTPDERDPAAWQVEPGDRLALVNWAGLRIAVVICLDIEQPALAARLQALDLDLVLVPTDTGSPSGHGRVFGCARARAVELCCAIAAVGGVGTIPLRPPRPNVSGAALFVPCEMSLAAGTGVLLDTGPRATGCGDADLVIVEDVPLGQVAAVRHGGAEVWPGPWPADHIQIVAA